MPSYLEMKNLFNNSDLKNRCETAVIKTATAMLNNPSVTAGDKVLIKKVYNDKGRYASLALNAVIMANESLTVAEVENLTDAQIQAVVTASAPLLVGM